jgi:hypothetical protein
MRTGEHRGNGGPWKRRKTKSGFPSLFHSPWKSPGAISTFPPRRQLVYISLSQKRPAQNQRKELGDAPARLEPFRLILTLENAGSAARHTSAASIPRGLAPVAPNNWFFGIDEGGKTAVVLRSFVASCQRAGLDPLSGSRMCSPASPPITRLAELLPHNCPGDSQPLTGFIRVKCCDRFLFRA